MNKILIKYRHNWGLDERLVLELMKMVLTDFGIDGAEVSLMFVGRTRAKKLNQQYRRMDYVPQVLGFPMDNDISEDGLRHMGDIVICTQKLKYEAKYLGKNIEEVLKDWLKHGVENLLKG